MNSNKGLLGGHDLGGDSCPPITFELFPVEIHGHTSPSNIARQGNHGDRAHRVS